MLKLISIFQAGADCLHIPLPSRRPPEKWLACQSLDNQIVVYAADSFRQNRKKIFKGHSVAGYACQVNFSPDGKFISSGDGDGNLVFWDWKSGRLLKRIRAHKEVVITHEWLPHETVSEAHTDCRWNHPADERRHADYRLARARSRSRSRSCTAFIRPTVKSGHRILGRSHQTLGTCPSPTFFHS